MACRCERSVGFAVLNRSIISRTLPVRWGEGFAASLIFSRDSARPRPLWGRQTRAGALLVPISCRREPRQRRPPALPERSHKPVSHCAAGLSSGHAVGTRAAD